MIYHFEDYVLDLSRRELRRGATSLSLEPQVFDLLVYLVAHRDRLVTKEELLGAVWNGRFVSDSALNTRMNAARGAIGDSGERQQLIRTLPRKGYRFIGAVQESSEVAVPAKALPAAPSSDAEIRRQRGYVRSKIGLYVAMALVLVGIAAGLSILLIQKPAPRNITGWVAAQFDSGRVPLVEDYVRHELALYTSKPAAKAIAISGLRRGATLGWGVAYGAADAEAAKIAALDLCRSRTTESCRLYAVGHDVVWPQDLIPEPLPGDLRSEPLNIPLVPEALPSVLARRSIAATYLHRGDHKALAVARGHYWYAYNKSSRSEAIRLARERCTYAAQFSCLLLSINNNLTVPIPQLHRVADVFLLPNERSISLADKERIAQVYQGQDWRALAHGKSGGWYPVAAQATEAAAVEAALALCEMADQDCRIYAISNFLIAADK